MILLDTNVLSEAFRSRPSEIVRAWYEAQTAANLFLCTPVLAELRYGVERLAAGARRNQLEEAVASIEDRFVDRILPLDRSAAHEFGRILARRNQFGRPIATMDALIAAIAVAYRATLATRDIADFDSIGLDLVDPFAPQQS